MPIREADTLRRQAPRKDLAWPALADLIVLMSRSEAACCRKCIAGENIGGASRKVCPTAGRAGRVCCYCVGQNRCLTISMTTTDNGAQMDATIAATIAWLRSSRSHRE